MAWNLCFVLLLLFFPTQEDAQTKFKRAAELQRNGAFAEAAAEYRSVLKLTPNHAETHANLGAVLARLGQYAEAVASYETALRLNPQLTPILFNLGVAHSRAGNFVAAADVLQQFVQVQPAAWQARQLLGLALVELGRDEEAIAQLEAALPNNAQDASLLFGLGLAYLRLDRPELNAMIERLAALPNGKAFAHLLKGQNYLAESDYQHAAEALAAAAQLNEQLPRLYFSLGVAYLRIGRNAEAIKAFERELQKQPRDYWTLYYLAFLFDAEGEFAAARDKAQAAILLQPRSADANALLGKVLLKLGQAAAAIPPLELAVAQNPTEAMLRFQLARAYQQGGRAKDAAREFAESQRLKDQGIEKERRGGKPQ